MSTAATPSIRLEVQQVRTEKITPEQRLLLLAHIEQPVRAWPGEASRRWNWRRPLRTHRSADGMTTADSKPVKIHEFTAGQFEQAGEHILCALIIGPDRDEPGARTLHLRINARALETIKGFPPAVRQMILEHLDRLLAEFRDRVVAA
jgi:hypothetical protein